MIRRRLLHGLRNHRLAPRLRTQSAKSNAATRSERVGSHVAIDPRFPSTCTGIFEAVTLTGQGTDAAHPYF